MFGIALVFAGLITDGDLRSRIESEFNESPVVNAAEIDVTVDDGIATLEGEVLNLEAKLRAVEIARSFRDVRAVIDLLDVAIVPRSDQQLQSLIKKRLAHNEATSDVEVDISARHGRVVLSGEVDSEVEHDLSQRIVRAIPGVQFVENRLRIKRFQSRTDEDLEADVRQRIRWDHQLDDDAIEVEVTDGRVKLSGIVGSDSDRFHASMAARIDGVREVDNQLVVRSDRQDPFHRDPLFRVDLKPAEIEAAIRDALRQDPRVGEIELDIQVSLGSVALRGNAESIVEKKAVEDTTRNTRGVRHVKNYLRVVRRDPRSDDEIRREIVDAFAHDPLVDRFEIAVAVDEGVVFLRGDIDSYYERARAEEVALHVAGIVELHNRLEVSDNAPEFDPTFFAYEPVKGFEPAKLGTIHIKPDEEILQAINSEIWWSPFVDADQVNVEVRAGVATLTGTVDSHAEAAAAVSNAMQGGAVVVKNNLKIGRR